MESVAARVGHTKANREHTQWMRERGEHRANNSAKYCPFIFPRGAWWWPIEFGGGGGQNSNQFDRTNRPGCSTPKSVSGKFPKRVCVSFIPIRVLLESGNVCCVVRRVEGGRGKGVRPVDWPNCPLYFYLHWVARTKENDKEREGESKDSTIESSLVFSTTCSSI